jgi:hypothetical protein
MFLLLQWHWAWDINYIGYRLTKIHSPESFVGEAIETELNQIQVRYT